MIRALLLFILLGVLTSGPLVVTAQAQDDPWGNLQNEPDPYAVMKKQIKTQQEQEAQRRAVQDAEQQRYQDNLIGRGHQQGGEVLIDSGAGTLAPRGRSNSGQKTPGFNMDALQETYENNSDGSGTPPNRSQSTSAQDLRAGDVHDTQPQPQPQQQQSGAIRQPCLCDDGTPTIYGICPGTSYVIPNC